MPTSKPLALLRDSIFRALNTIPTMRRFLSEAGIKPQPRYTKGFTLPNSGTRFIASLTGSMLPQPEITISDGHKVLLDNALGQGFALLRLYDDPLKAFASLQADIWQRLDVRFVAIQNQDKHFPLRNPNLFVLVRPDRYILGIFKDGRESAFVAHLQRYLASFR